MVNVTYPKAYQNFLNVLNIFNIDSWVRSAGCMTYMDFRLRFLIMTIGPILTVPILAGTYLYVVKRHGASRETLDYAWQKHVSSVLFIMFFVYNGASSVTFPMFVCDPLDDGRTYLRVDYSIECWTEEHEGLMTIAAFMVLVYPLGIPAFFALLLLKNRRVLLNKDLRENASSSVRAISDLWKPYKPSRFYYEIIEFVRRLMLMLVGLYVSPDSATQVVLTVMIAVIFAMMSEALAPYECRLDMWVNRLGHAVVILSLYFVLLLKVNISNDSQDSQDMFGNILITTHLLMILTAISEAFLTGCSSSNGQVEDSRPRRRYYPRLRGVSGSLVRTSPMIHDSLGKTEIELVPSGHGRNNNKSARSECEGGGRPPKIEPITVRLKRSESV